MAEVADEEQAVARRRGSPARRSPARGRSGRHGRRRRGARPAAPSRSRVGDDEHGVGGAVRPELALLRAGGARGGGLVAGQLGLALLADVVHVDRVDDDACERSVLAQHRHVLRGEVVEGRGSPRRSASRRAAPGRSSRRGAPRLLVAVGIAVVHLDPGLLERRAVTAAVVGALAGDERDGMPGAGEQEQQLVQAAGAGRAVEHRHQRVDHEQPLARDAVARTAHERRMRRLLRAQRLGPLLAEALAVCDLVLLEAGGRVGAGGRALVVDDRGGRLVDDLEPALADGEAEVGVLVVGGRVALVEAAELVPDGARDEQAGAGAVVDRADEVEARVGRVAAAPVVPAGRVGEDDAAGLLQPAVGVDELRADGADAGAPCDVEQRLEPAGLRLGVVVEQHQLRAGRVLRREVVAADEAEVLGAADDLQRRRKRGRERLERVAAAVGRGVVDDDDLVAALRRSRGDRIEAFPCELELPVDADEDRDIGHAEDSFGRGKTRAGRQPGRVFGCAGRHLNAELRLRREPAAKAGRAQARTSTSGGGGDGARPYAARSRSAPSCGALE